VTVPSWQVDPEPRARRRCGVDGLVAFLRRLVERAALGGSFKCW
jgi:hypothetical protein